MLLYHETFHLPPVEEHRSMPLQFTWCHWFNQETDTDVRKHYLLHFLFTSYTALWASQFRMMSKAVWIFVRIANSCVTFCRTLCASWWSTWKEVLFVPCCTVIGNWMRTRQSSTQHRLFWPWTFCTSLALCTGRQFFVSLCSIVIEMTVNK